MLTLIVYICLLGGIVAVVYRWVPIPQGFKLLVYIVCIVTAVFLLLQALGIPLTLPATPRLR